MSQQTLASRADLSTRTVARIEAGEDCAVSTLQKLAQVLEVDITELFDTGEREPAELAT